MTSPPPGGTGCPRSAGPWGRPRRRRAARRGAGSRGGRTTTTRASTWAGRPNTRPGVRASPPSPEPFSARHTPLGPVGSVREPDGVDHLDQPVQGLLPGVLGRGRVAEYERGGPLAGRAVPVGEAVQA